ncbi:hypothetical protein KUV57_11060 [Epibacterium sp. DP7N7-1]|nr:hypothetical protein [Epibacterium sp. DP7N7-1]
MSESSGSPRAIGKWGVLTLHERLPSRSEQIARARAWGVTESMNGLNDIPSLVIDDVMGVRTTNWPSRLKKRASFLEEMCSIAPAGDQVFFATPLCVGFSPTHAHQTIERLWSCGMLVYVHSLRGNGAALYAGGDDISDFLDMVDTEQNTSSVRMSRNRSI